MEIARSSALRIAHPTLVAAARRLVGDHAAALAWDAPAIGTAHLIVTELATNLLKHACDGTLIVSSRREDGRGSLQLVAIDRGPGMMDVARCLEDGYSTAGSPGTGFGAVQRLASRMEVLSTPGKGTIVVADYAPPEPRSARAPRFDIGAFAVARQGETECGDAWAAKVVDGALAVMVCDGLGHGAAAAAAARAAQDVFRTSVALEPKSLLELAHQSLRGTRGAALAFALIDPNAAELRYCGIGNICAHIVHRSSVRHLVSHDGIVGHRAARIAQFTSCWEHDADLVMHTDGVSGRWRPEEWPGLWVRGPSAIAAAIWRDHSRAADDATVLVARERR